MTDNLNGKKHKNLLEKLPPLEWFYENSNLKKNKILLALKESSPSTAEISRTIEIINKTTSPTANNLQYFVQEKIYHFYQIRLKLKLIFENPLMVLVLFIIIVQLVFSVELAQNMLK